MIGLIQRVSEAEVVVDGDVVGKISRGILLLLGFQKGDTSPDAEKLLKKVVRYRIFPDRNGQMNLSLADTEGELLVVPQFTIAADTGRGLRPSFSAAAPPGEARHLFEEFLDLARQECRTRSGVFGADMKVRLVNDGPVTFILSV